MQLPTSLPRGSPLWPPHLPQGVTRRPEEPLQGPPSGGLCSRHPLPYASPPPGADETPGSEDQAPPSRVPPEGLPLQQSSARLSLRMRWSGWWCHRQDRSGRLDLCAPRTGDHVAEGTRAPVRAARAGASVSAAPGTLPAPDQPPLLGPQC